MYSYNHKIYSESVKKERGKKKEKRLKPIILLLIKSIFGIILLIHLF